MTAAAAPLAILPELGPPGWIALGVIGIGAAGYAGYKWYQSRSDATTNADEKAKGLSEEAATQTCQGCKENPCAHLANGVPGSKYHGGAHGSTKLPKGDGLESHHTPADAVSPLPRDVGPAIQMDPSDHARTASNGRVPGSALYRARQEALIDDGNFMGAVGMDIADVHSTFGSKYDSALAQMTAYARCLKKHGLVK